MRLKKLLAFTSLRYRENAMDAITNIRALLKEGVTEVKVFISHYATETGSKIDADTGRPIPARFIQEMNCLHEGKVVFSAFWGTGISDDPYIAFRFKRGQLNDKIVFQWQDNQGKTAVVETFIETA